MLNQTIDSFADTCKEIVGEIKSSVSKYETHGEPAKSTPSRGCQEFCVFRLTNRI